MQSRIHAIHVTPAERVQNLLALIQYSGNAMPLDHRLQGTMRHSGIWTEHLYGLRSWVYPIVSPAECRSGETLAARVSFLHHRLNTAVPLAPVYPTEETKYVSFSSGWILAVCNIDDGFDGCVKSRVDIDTRVTLPPIIKSWRCGSMSTVPSSINHFAVSKIDSQHHQHPTN